MAWTPVALLLLVGTLCAAAAGDQLPAPIAGAFNCSADGSLWPYLLQDSPGPPQAVLIYFHGHYSDHHQGMTEGSYNDAFGRLRRECLRRNWVYVCAYYGGNTWMGPTAESGVADLIAHLKARLAARSQTSLPVYICGGSMGGSSVLVFATRRPALVSGVIALCPAGDIQAYYQFAVAHKEGVLANIAAAIRIHYTSDGHDLAAELRARSAALNAERLTMPMYISHGAKDALIPVSGARALVDRLQRLHRPVQYVELPEGDHDAPVVQVDWPAALDFVSAKRAP